MADYDDDPYADEGGGRPGLPIDPMRIVRIYLRSWRWIVVALAIGAVAGVVYAKTQVQKVYEGETVIGYTGTDYDDREVQSMVESMTLVQNLEVVKKRLGLKGGAAGLASKIKLAFEPRFSNLIYVRTQASSGKGAKSFADTVATVFVEQQAQLNRAKKDEVARKLQMDLEVAQARLSYAREVYDAFRNRYGVMDLSEETNAALQQAIALRSQAEAAEQTLKAAEGAAQDLRSRIQKAGPEPALDPAADDDEEANLPLAPEDVPLESQAALDTARRALAAAQVRLSPDHPEIKLLEAKVRDLERRVAGPAGAATGRGLSSRLASAQRSQGDAQSQARRLSAQAAEAEARLKQLAQGEGEAAPLLADLGVADLRMRDVKGRLNLALDEARNTVPPFHIVALSTEATTPVESKAKLVALAGPIVALVLALILVLVRGLRGLRMYTPAEIAYWGNGPVIGATSWPRDPSMLATLFRELDDCTPFASGLTLIVGAHETESSLARGVAMLWPAERYAANTQEAQSAMTVVDPNTQEQSDQTPEKVVIGHAGGGGGGGGRGGAAIVPLQVARASLLRAQPEELGPTRESREAEREVINIAQSWNGPLSGPELRRASRLADRVLVVVRSGQRSLFELSSIRTRLGRDRGIGFLVVDLDHGYTHTKDRIGNVNDFWRATRETH